MGIRTSARIEGIPHYEPGLTMAEVMDAYGLESVVKLASNESPFPPLPEVKAVIDEGLSAGELVIVDGLQRVRPGITVQANPIAQSAGRI